MDQASRLESSLMSSSVRLNCPVLYVDDSSDDHFLVQRAAINTETPLQIQPFFSGEPAIAYLKHIPPFQDIAVYPSPYFLLCDYDLGTTKGHDLVAAVRSIATCANLPIIMFSGADGDDSVAKSYLAGADHFLCKPLQTARLEILVQTLYACAMSTPTCFDALIRLSEYEPCPATGHPAYAASRLATSLR